MADGLALRTLIEQLHFIVPEIEAIATALGLPTSSYAFANNLEEL